MEKIFFIILLNVAFIQDLNKDSIHRCILDDDGQSRIERPLMDTFSISPSGLFHIHYDTSGIHSPNLNDDDINGIPDYIDAVGIAADSSKYVLVDQMGYQTPHLYNEGIYDIYIEDLGPFFYGLNMFEFFVGGSYIIIDNEFEEGEYFTLGIPAMQIAIAHEYFHAIQRNYAQLILGQDKYFWELSSMWIEDVIYPQVNDYIYWIDYYLENPEQNISDYYPDNPDSINDAGYSLSFLGHYLTNVYDQVEDPKNSVIMRKVWETFTGFYDGEAHLSINEVLNEDYNSNFIEAWTTFCSKNLYNGLYANFNNTIYYHVDQLIANPIQTSINILNDDIAINDILLNNESIAPILSFSVARLTTLSLNHSLSENNSFGLANIISGEIINNQIIELAEQSSILLSASDTIHLVYSTNSSNQILNLEIQIDEYPGDLNDDGFLDILDIVSIVSIIMDNESEYNLIGDLNEDGINNILDIVQLVIIILSQN